MQNQKDHVDAYSVQIGRMSSALLLGEIGHFDPPARRAVLGIVGGLVLALLIGVVCGVYGLIRPGGKDSWREAGAVVVEKETGNRYVLLEGQLHPVLNYASALLMQGPGAHVVSVHTSSLGDVERGAPVGLPGAPDTVPTAADLSSTGWTLCLPASGAGQGVGTGQGESTGQGEGTSRGVPRVAIDFTGAADAGTTAESNSYSLVRSVSGTEYVLVDGLKSRVVDPALPVVLGLQEAPVPTAPDDWLAQVPDGVDLDGLEVPDAGSGGFSLGARTFPVGTLLEYRAPAGGSDQNQGVQNYVVASDGLALVDRLDAALLQGGGVAAQPLDAAEVAAAPRSATSWAGRLPDLTSEQASNLLTGENARTPCLRQRPEGRSVRSSVETAPAAQVLAGAVTVAAGTGILAASVPVPGPGKPDRYLIDDQGVKYLLGSDEAIQALGYGGVEPVAVPVAVLGALPSGPDLTRPPWDRVLNSSSIPATIPISSTTAAQVPRKTKGEG
ncbi:MAG: type VII secretion protein EccB [Janthinobacterium lividum]